MRTVLCVSSTSKATVVAVTAAIVGMLCRSGVKHVVRLLLEYAVLLYDVMSLHPSHCTAQLLPPPHLHRETDGKSGAAGPLAKTQHGLLALSAALVYHKVSGVTTVCSVVCWVQPLQVLACNNQVPTVVPAIATLRFHCLAIFCWLLLGCPAVSSLLTAIDLTGI